MSISNPPTPAPGGSEMTKKKTMYMHTYDGKPVAFKDFGGWYMSTYAGGRVVAQLRSSLRAIRRDLAIARKDLAARQRADVSAAKRRAALDKEFARYGHVRVEVPR
jgi:hypothetical protein